MSEENVEVVRNAGNAYLAFMRGELSREATAEVFDPEVEYGWHGERTLPDLPQHLRGPSQYFEFVERLRGSWADMEGEILEVIETPGDRVLLLIRQSARGRESGVPLTFHSFLLSTVRDGRVWKMELFRHRADALEAAGLSE
jgi:ketosteroid isomerase-like protein